jgi:hypothetical protein
VCVEKVERVQRRLIRYALRSLSWTDIYNLPPYEVKRHSVACVMFIFDILSGRMNSPNFLSALDLNTPRYRTRVSEFLQIGFHHTNYGFMDFSFSGDF